MYNESRWGCSFRQVTFISIALYSIQIVPNQLHSNEQNLWCKLHQMRQNSNSVVKQHYRWQYVTIQLSIDWVQFNNCVKFISEFTSAMKQLYRRQKCHFFQFSVASIPFNNSVDVDQTLLIFIMWTKQLKHWMFCRCKKIRIGTKKIFEWTIPINVKINNRPKLAKPISLTFK